MMTLSSITEKLRLKRQDNEFRFSNEDFSSGNKKNYQFEDLQIIRPYRFEGESDPEDIIYLIEANDGLIGFSIAAYGAYTDYTGDEYHNFIRKIPVAEKRILRS